MASIDKSVLRSPVQLGVSGFLQLLQSYHVGTEEVRQALVQHCDFIMECRVCRSLFRGLPNFLAHKRHYCEDPNRSIEASMENVRIVQTNPNMFIADPEEGSFSKESPDEDGDESHSVLFESLVPGSEHQRMSSQQTDLIDVDGILPIPCQGVCGMTNFLLHHNLIDKSGRVCTICKYSTPNPKRLRWHVEAKHVKKYSLFQCSHCLKVYDKVAMLQSHLVLDHNVSSTEAQKAASSNQSKVEKLIIGDSVYNPPLEKPQGEYKDISRQIVLKIFDCLNILKFTHRDQYRAKCIVHPGENLYGFQSIRRHLVDHHLKSDNVCMFCPQWNSSFGFLVKHMVMAHDLSLRKIEELRDKIRVHFSKSEKEQSDKSTDSGTSVCVVKNDTNELTLGKEESSEQNCDSQNHDDEDAKQHEKSMKREHASIDYNPSTEPKTKKQKVSFVIRQPVKPIPACRTRTWMSFVRHNKFFSPAGHCRYCNAVLKSRRSQGKHLLNRHLRKQKMYQCRKCGLVFQQVKSFESHLLTLHGIMVNDVALYEVEKFILQNGRVFDIPVKFESVTPTTTTSADDKTDQVVKQHGISSAVLYSEREMLLATITCMYIVKFKSVGERMAECVHHPEVVFLSFAQVVEHLVTNHIKEDYTCFMCPFRRKDVSSLIKHMAVTHHMSVDRIQRLKEKIKSTLDVSKLTDATKLNFASVCFKAVDKILAVLMSNREGHGGDSVLDERNDSLRSKLYVEVKSPKCFFSGKDLMVALIDCLGIIRFQMRPKNYQPKAKYTAMCLDHPHIQMDSLPEILAHLADKHLKSSYKCILCSLQTQTLELLAEHMIRIHGLTVKKILNMEEAVRFSLLQKHHLVDTNKTEAGLDDDETMSNRNKVQVTGHGIPCPRCGKKLTTFKRISKHLQESHLVRPKLAVRLIERLRLRMQHEEQKPVIESSNDVSGSEPIQTKSGRMVRRISDTHNETDAAKDSMFGLDDVKCTICGKSYPLTSAAITHVTKVHKVKPEESRKQLIWPVRVNLAGSICENAPREENAVTSRLRRGVQRVEQSDGMNVSLFGNEDLPCTFCMKVFPRKTGLINHYMRLHNITREEAHKMVQRLCGHTHPKADNQTPLMTNKRKQTSPRKLPPEETNGNNNAKEKEEESTDEGSIDIKSKEKRSSECNQQVSDQAASDSKNPESQPGHESSSSSNFEQEDQVIDNSDSPKEAKEVSCDKADEDVTASTILAERTWSMPVGKDSGRGLYRCVECGKFFAGIAETDTKEPKCKKCQ